MKILVTGVAKAGKSTVMRILSESGYRTINASMLLAGSECVKWNEYYQSFDIINEDCAADLVNRELSTCGDRCAVETVAYELVDPGSIGVVIVVRRNPLELYDEYVRLRWPCIKMFNNIVSEVTGSHVNSLIMVFNDKVRQLVFTPNLNDLRVKVLRALNGELNEDVDWLSVGGERLHEVLINLERCLKAYTP